MSSHGDSCLGFCARTPINASVGLFTPCQSCNWGSRSQNGFCEECTTPIGSYDIMYLVFHALIPILLHIRFVRKARKYCRTRIFEATEHMCIIAENVLACLSTILVYPPYGSLRLFACNKATIKDWYPQSYAPLVAHQKLMRCAYEVVFPLYSMPYAHCLFLMLYIIIFRGVLYSTLLYKTYNGKPFYYALLSLPIVIVVHGLMSGIIYYTFPYVLLIGSVVAITVQLALEGKRTIKELLVRLAKSATRLLFLFMSMAILAFALIALLSIHYFNFYVPPLNVDLELISRRWYILLLVPLPPVVYILSMPFSHPSAVGEASWYWFKEDTSTGRAAVRHKCDYPKKFPTQTEFYSEILKNCNYCSNFNFVQFDSCFGPETISSHFSLPPPPLKKRFETSSILRRRLNSPVGTLFLGLCFLTKFSKWPNANYTTPLGRFVVKIQQKNLVKKTPLDVYDKARFRCNASIARNSPTTHF